MKQRILSSKMTLSYLVSEAFGLEMLRNLLKYNPCERELKNELKKINLDLALINRKIHRIINNFNQEK